MKVRERMSLNVQLANPDDTIRDAARVMVAIDTGILPVGDKDRLVGMITDRDIAVRGVAEGKGPDARVSEVMSRDVRYCFDDDETEAVLRNMGDLQVRRLPVVNRDKRLVGIVSLSDLARPADAAEAGGALEAITRPGGEHSQKR